MRLTYRLMTFLISFLLVFSMFPIESFAKQKSDTPANLTKTIQANSNRDEPVDYIIKYKDADKGKKQLEKIDKTKKKDFKHVKLSKAKLSKKDADALRNDANVEYIEPDQPIVKSADIVDINLKQIHAPEAHEKGYLGTDVKVAVFDTGVDRESTELRIAGGVSFVESEQDYDDLNGHGTMMAGLVSSLQDGEGLIGAAPNVKLFAVKVLDQYGIGTYSQVIDAIDWAIDNHMDIVSMSFAGKTDSRALHEAMDFAQQNGILLIAAAGNDATNRTDYPAQYSSVISVGAVDQYNNLAAFSNRGKIDLVAPGVQITGLALNNEPYLIANGTSMSTAQVAGAAAILKGAKPELTNQEIQSLLTRGALPLGNSTLFGSGLLNVVKSLNLLGFSITEVPYTRYMNQSSDLSFLDLYPPEKKTSVPITMEELESLKQKTANEEPSVITSDLQELVNMASGTSDSNILNAIHSMTVKTNQAPYQVNNSMENISTISANMTTSATDFYLPGRNGLSFSLTRTYDSSAAQLYKPEYEARIYCLCRVDFTTFGYLEKKKKDANGNLEAGSILLNPHSTTYIYDSNNYSWMSDLLDSINWEIYLANAFGGGKVYLQTEWSGPDSDGYYSRYIEYGTNNFNLSDGGFTYYLGMRTVTRNATTEETVYPIGKGWSWNIPFIKKVEDKTYINSGSGSTYEIDGYTLKDYPWKDLSISYSSSVTVNNETSYYVLSSISGIKHYFTYEGRLIEIADPYNNTIQFKYTTNPKYGKVISSITDAVGNSIQFEYTTNQVILKQGNKTVTYQKSTIERMYERYPVTLQSEKLESVTDANGRITRYKYDMKNAYSSIGYEAANNPFLYLTEIDHPTGAQTKYIFENSAVTRLTTSTAFYQSYRLKSRYDTTGTSNFNKVDLTFSGDDSYPPTGNSLYSLSMSNGLVTSTYNNRKVYFNDETPNMYYTDSVVQTQKNGTEQRKTTYVYDEAKKRPNPIQEETVITDHGVSASPIVNKATYDDYGNILTSTNPLNVTTTYQYDTSGLLSSVTQPIDTAKKQFTKYTRNAKGTVTQITVRENNSTGNVISDLFLEDIDPETGNVRKMRQPVDGRDIVKTIEYSPIYHFAYPTKETVVTYGYDGVKQTNTTSYEYDASTGQVTKVADLGGAWTKYAYDKLGRVTTVTNVDNSSKIIDYFDTQNVVRVKDETGVTIESHYSPLGWIVESGNVVNGVFKVLKKYDYDAYGRVFHETDGQGRVTEYGYDDWGRVTSTKYGSGTSTVSYDDVNRVQVATDAEGNSMKTESDVLGQVLNIYQYINGASVLIGQNQYNSAGLVTKQWDSNLKSTSFDYNASGQLKTVTNPLGEQTQYTYNSLGLLRQIEYSDHSKSTKEYDELGRIITTTDQSGKSENFGYDLSGNLILMINRKGVELTFEYDNRNMLRKKISPTETVDFHYDKAGRRDSMTDLTGTTGYKYYPATGLLETVTFPDGHKLEYEYDGIGNRQKMTDPFGNQEVYSYYPDRNLLKSVGSSTTDLEATYSYNKNGQPQSIQYNKNGIVQSYAYKNARLDSVVHKKSDGTIFNKFQYIYDNNGNITTRYEDGTPYAYTYDDLNRIETNSQYNESYSYDNKGNRIALASDELPTIHVADYDYDDWDRLKQVTTEDGTQITYKYNGDGLLYERSENGNTKRYYNDGDQIIAEASVVNNSPQYVASYIRGLGLAARKDSSGSMSYYLTNGHGDVVELRDSAGGPLNQYSYDIWGTPLSANGDVDNPFMYSGEYWDGTVGLQYLRARWYDPSVGRFINEDSYEGSITNPLSLNLYTYVENNPLRYFDPTGHDPLDILDTVGFSWAKKKAIDAITVIGKYTYGAFTLNAGPAAYNAVIGKDFYSGEQLSTTMRVINGVNVALMFLPEFGEVGAILPRAGAILPESVPMAAKLAFQESQSYASVVDKLSRYLLNPEHPVGGMKAEWFKQALGFTLDNLETLAKQIKFDPSKAIQTSVTEFGTKYNQIITITGSNGKVIDVPFAWIKNNDGVVRLVTGLPVKP